MTRKRIVLIVCGVVLATLFMGVTNYFAYGEYLKYQNKKENIDKESQLENNSKINDENIIEENQQDDNLKINNENLSPYTLVGYTGQVFGAKVPKGWNISDNESGIDIVDNTDSSTGAIGAIAVGWFGLQTPDGFIDFMLQTIGAQNVVYENESAQEEITDPNSSLKWQIKTKTFTFTKDNKQIKAKASAGVLKGYGQFMGMITAFQTTPDKWSMWAPTLERIAKSITIINSSKAGGIDKVKLPTAADLKNDFSPLMESWKYRNNVNDRSSHEFSDAIMGQETDLYSPSTSQKYNRPLSDYDPTIGGYRNPDNTSEILIDPYER